MASTRLVTINTDWTLIASAVTHVAIQLSNQGTIEVHVGDAEPGPEDVGIEISNTIQGMPSTVSLSSLPEEALVWGRARKATDLVVLSY